MFIFVLFQKRDGIYWWFLGSNSRTPESEICRKFHIYRRRLNHLIYHFLFPWVIKPYKLPSRSSKQKTVALHRLYEVWIWDLVELTATLSEMWVPVFATFNYPACNWSKEEKAWLNSRFVHVIHADQSDQINNCQSCPILKLVFYFN